MARAVGVGRWAVAETLVRAALVDVRGKVPGQTARERDEVRWNGFGRELGRSRVSLRPDGGCTGTSMCTNLCIKRKDKGPECIWHRDFCQAESAWASNLHESLDNWRLLTIS